MAYRAPRGPAPGTAGSTSSLSLALASKLPPSRLHLLVLLPWRKNGQTRGRWGTGQTRHISQPTGMDEKMGKRGRMKEDRDRQVQMDRLRQKHVPVYMDRSWAGTHTQVLGYECQHLSSGSSRGSLAQGQEALWLQDKPLVYRYTN